MSAKPDADVVDVIEFRDAVPFEAWLAEHVEQQLGVWLKIARRGPALRR